MKHCGLLNATVVSLIFLSLEVWAADNARWKEGEIGEWSVNTNAWQSETDSPLPAPGYAVSNHVTGVGTGWITVSAQNAAVSELYMSDEARITVTNSRSLTVWDAANFRAADGLVGYIVVPDGTVEIVNGRTGVVCGLSFELGTAATSGHLALGAPWAATNGFPASFGILDTVLIRMENGGLRVNADTIVMRNNTTIVNRGQAMLMRGDWLNSGTTTVFVVEGKGPDPIEIGGDWSFGGCHFLAKLDTNGVSLVDVGGNAILTNAVLTVGCADALDSLADSYDLVRVPANKSIYTNGMSFAIAENGGFTYEASIDENRNGYNYLVIEPGVFLPKATITAPDHDAFFKAVTNIVIQASAIGRSSPVSKVEFYADDIKIGEATNAPYASTWNSVNAGYYRLTAVATDANSNRGTSDPVAVNVQGVRSDGKRALITGGAVIVFDPECAQ